MRVPTPTRVWDSRPTRDLPPPPHAPTVSALDDAFERVHLPTVLKVPFGRDKPRPMRISCKRPVDADRVERSHQRHRRRLRAR